MRIGVDLCDLDPDYAGGVNSFAFGLLHGLLADRRPDDRIVLLATARNVAFLRAKYAGDGADILLLPSGNRHIHALLTLLAWGLGAFRLRYGYDRLARGAVMRRVDGAVDALVAPLTVLSVYGARAPAILSIHDIQQEYHPEFFSWRERVRRWAPYRLSAWRAAAVQASSHYIKDCLLEKFRFLSPGKIAVIPEGVDRQTFSPSAPMEMPPALVDIGGFVFYPAQIWAHKNHLMLVEALALHRDQSGAEMPCVLTGKDYGHWPAVAARIAARGLQHVHYLGRVRIEELLWLYGNCRAVLALGLHESSSLPVREGAVFGKVLVALDIAPNREAQRHLRLNLVTGTQDLAAVLGALARSEADMLAQGAENERLVERFDWKAIAGEYRGLLQQLCGSER